LIKEIYIVNNISPEEFHKIFNEQAIKSFNKQVESKKFKHEYIGMDEDGRLIVKITCHNRWLNEEVSIILNNDQFGTVPFPGGHLFKLMVLNNDGEKNTLFGFFADNIREYDECLYIDNIVDTLRLGATDEFFGTYLG